MSVIIHILVSETLVLFEKVIQIVSQVVLAMLYSLKYRLLRVSFSGHIDGFAELCLGLFIGVIFRVQ